MIPEPREHAAQLGHRGTVVSAVRLEEMACKARTDAQEPPGLAARMGPLELLVQAARQASTVSAGRRELAVPREQRDRAVLREQQGKMEPQVRQARVASEVLLENAACRVCLELRARTASRAKMALRAASGSHSTQR